MDEKKEKQYVSDNARLMEEWDWEKNEELGFDPQNITVGSTKKVWWKCSKSHEWQATIASRNYGRGCPYCSNKKVLFGYNDLQSVNPVLAKEWNYEKNGNLKPEDVSAGSNKKVWWKCDKGHEWQANIVDRNNGNGCPYCSNKKVLFGYNDLQSVNPVLAKEWNYEKNNGLMPMDVTAKSDKKVWWKCEKGHEWQANIYSRQYGSGCPICNSESRTSFPEYALEYYFKKHNIEVIHSYREYGYELDIYIPSKKVGVEYDGYYWHQNKVKEDLEKNQKCKNDGIKLYRIREGLPTLNDSSIDYIVQKDQKDLSKALKKILEEIIGANIVLDIKKDAIAIDNLRKYTEKETSLLFSNTNVAKEWNYEKNGDLRPEHFTSNSHKKVWWKCDKGHEWEATIANRNHGYGCPYCTGQKVLLGYNDLQTINPILAKEWNYEKNGDIKPENVSFGSNKKVWWKCDKGHEWEATINHRNHGQGCPYCSSKQNVKGKHDLKSINPILAKEWNYEKNGDLKPEDVSAGSNKKVWWKCDKGHEWQSRIDHRNKGSRCPYCSGRYIIKGKNDLQTVNPTLANEWNYKKNDTLMPSDVMPNSHKKVWWKCSKGHEWQMSIKDRNRGCICPECSKEKRKK